MYNQELFDKATSKVANISLQGHPDSHLHGNMNPGAAIAGGTLGGAFHGSILGAGIGGFAAPTGEGNVRKGIGRGALRGMATGAGAALGGGLGATQGGLGHTLMGAGLGGAAGYLGSSAAMGEPNYTKPEKKKEKETSDKQANMFGRDQVGPNAIDIPVLDSALERGIGGAFLGAGVGGLAAPHNNTRLGAGRGAVKGMSTGIGSSFGGNLAHHLAERAGMRGTDTFLPTIAGTALGAGAGYLGSAAALGKANWRNPEEEKKKTTKKAAAEDVMSLLSNPISHAANVPLSESMQRQDVDRQLAPYKDRRGVILDPNISKEVDRQTKNLTDKNFADSIASTAGSGLVGGALGGLTGGAPGLVRGGSAGLGLGAGAHIGASIGHKKYDNSGGGALIGAGIGGLGGYLASKPLANLVDSKKKEKPLEKESNLKQQVRAAVKAAVSNRRI